MSDKFEEKEFYDFLELEDHGRFMFTVGLTWGIFVTSILLIGSWVFIKF